MVANLAATTIKLTSVAILILTFLYFALLRFATIRLIRSPPVFLESSVDKRPKTQHEVHLFLRLDTEGSHLFGFVL